MSDNDPIIPHDMSNAIKHYDTEATKLLKEFTEEVEAKKPLPPILYHYTNRAGLAGIIESGKMRLSDIFRQNDPSELKHGLCIALNVLKSEITAERPEVKEFAKRFTRFCLHGGIEESAHYFICCFSGDSDDLGQWRAYANNGQGFALGFDTSSLKGGFENENGALIGQNSTFPITYNDLELKRIQTALAKMIVPLISLPRKISIESGSLNDNMKKLSIAHSMNVIPSVMYFKHEAYQNENEYRFLQIFRSDMPAPDVKYKAQSMVKYREFDWRSNARGVLKKIVVGPAANQVQATRFIKDCFAAYHIDSDGIEIVRSKIPYRI